MISVLFPEIEGGDTDTFKMENSPYKGNGSNTGYSPSYSAQNLTSRIALFNSLWSQSEGYDTSVVEPSPADQPRGHNDLYEMRSSTDALGLLSDPFDESNGASYIGCEKSVWSMPHHITTDNGCCYIPEEMCDTNENKCALTADANQSLGTSTNWIPSQQNNKLQELQRKYTTKEPMIPFCNFSVSNHNNAEEHPDTTNSTSFIWKLNDDKIKCHDSFSAALISNGSTSIDDPHLNTLEKNWPQGHEFANLSFQNPNKQQNKSTTLPDQSPSLNTNNCGYFSLNGEYFANAFNTFGQQPVSEKLQQEVGGNYRDANNSRYCKDQIIGCSDFQNLSEAQVTKANSCQQLNNEVHKIREATYVSQSDPHHNFGQPWFGRASMNQEEKFSLDQEVMTSDNCHSMHIRHNNVHSSPSESIAQLGSMVPSIPIKQENYAYQDSDIKNIETFHSPASTTAQTETFIAERMDSTLLNHVHNTVYGQSRFRPQQQREQRRSVPDDYSNYTYKPTPPLMYSKHNEVPSHSYNDTNLIHYFTAENCGSLQLITDSNSINKDSQIPYLQSLLMGGHHHSLPPLRSPILSQPQRIPLDLGNAPSSYTDFHTSNDYYTSNEFLIPRMVHSGHGVPVFVPPDQTKRVVAPSLQLHCWLDACYEQWRALENERKKTEWEMARCYSDSSTANAVGQSGTRLPFNPSRVDRLIVDQLRQQAKVVALLSKMECLRSTPLHANISSSLDRHLEAIYNLNIARRTELSSIGHKNRQTQPKYHEQRDIVAIASSLAKLYHTTQRARTAFWSALQMTLPKVPKACPDMLDGVISTYPAITCVNAGMQNTGVCYANMQQCDSGN